jgi:hypothetical protein
LSVRVRCVDLDVFAVDADRVAVRLGETDLRVLPAETASLASRCRAYRTIAEHAAAICSELALDEDARDGLGEELEALVAQGLLASEDELLGACARVASAEIAPPPIATVGVPTRGRPESLARCVASWADNLARYGRRAEIAVHDQTDDPSTREAIRDRLRAIAGATGVGIRYAGHEELRLWCDRARALGAPPDLLEALAGPLCRNIGDNRNVLLLDTLGQLVLSVDDDTVCQLGAPAGADEGLRAVEREDFQETPFLDLESALRASRPLDADVLALHEKVLGRSIAHAIDRASPAGVDLDDASPQWASRIASGAARIAVTHAGLAGDAATTYAPHWLSVAGPSWDLLFGDEEVFRRSYPTRWMVRSVPRATVFRSDWCLSFCLGLDNRAGLPPFLHMHRTSDGLFGLVLRATQPDQHLAILPHVVAHDPRPARPPGPAGQMQRSEGLLPGALAIGWLDACRFGPGAPPGPPRLRKLGRHLIELADADPQELARDVGARRLSERAELRGHLARLLEERTGAPAHWVQTVQLAMRAAEEGITAGPLLDLGDGCCGGQSPWETLRRKLRRAGRTLEAWPELVEVAQELGRRGHRISERLGVRAG